MANLRDTATHITGIKGKIRTATSPPVADNVAGLGAGGMYYDSDSHTLYVYDGSLWKGKILTTTSTSTSTSTTTSTTTTA